MTNSTPPARLGPTPRPGVLGIERYVGGRAKAPGGIRTVKLSANETPLGASPEAMEACRGAVGRSHLYPDGGAVALREAIAAKHGLDPQRILVGNGSDEIFHLLAQAYLGPGDEILHSAHGFLVYPIAARAAGADVVVVPEKNLTIDVDALVARASPRTRMVSIANPNNPTGTYLPASEIVRLRQGLRADILLVLDAAYAEYANVRGYTAGLEFVHDADNVVMTRTFSKVFGLAALRLGWAYCPLAVADAVDRIRSPFNVSSLAQAAGIAALGDDKHLARAIAHNTEWRAWLTDEIGKIGNRAIEVVPSAGNFLLLRFPNTQGLTAAEADVHLTTKGLLLRRLDAYGLPDCLRLSVGLGEDNRAVVEALKEFVHV